MKHFEQLVEPDQQMKLSLKWEEAFRDLMDEIYFSGYSKQLLEENPVVYQKEYFYFIALYDEPPLDI